MSRLRKAGSLIAVVALIASFSTISSAQSMQPITLAQWQQIRTSTNASLTVVDFWATWCSSCLQRFPKMVELHDRYSKKGVRFIGLNLDDPNDSGAVQAAEQFLQKVGAEFNQYHMTDNLMFSFEQLDLLGIPAVQFLDSSGSEILRLTGDHPDRQFTDEDVEAFISEWLNTDSTDPVDH